MESKPCFLQGAFPFVGKGFETPVPISAALRYEVPGGAAAQPVYLRAGNSSGELVCVVLMRNGVPMRYFPVGAKDATHVSLRIVEDLEAGTVVEVHLAAADGVTGTVVVDLGLVEV
ncbi:hypothetical protein GCM10022221_29430 [Actinocorallia aurea]